ncbi:ATP-binding protein [Streptomyces sp. NBC_01537]|uniref:ATP-binding protein n=1 Tax=Streptomyces sp. NBC_01537 TaxID=2903896 RepID=UPI003866BD55
MLIPTTSSTCASGRHGEPLAHAAIDLTGFAAPQRAARGLVRDALSGIANQDWVDDVTLAADELVGNAYQHAGAAGEMGIALDLYVWGATVQVSDGGADAGAVPDPPKVTDEQAEGGRGLFLVDSLATAWGVLASSTGKIVIAVFLHQAAG